LPVSQASKNCLATAVMFDMSSLLLASSKAVPWTAEAPSDRMHRSNLVGNA